MAWFEKWFDSPYYPILYAYRNEEEAGAFVSKLVDTLQVNTNSTCLDLACGRGRHARFIGKFAGKVIGLDLSPVSIQEAAQINHLPNVQFYVADMRTFALAEKFDFVFNLFTSFGYFEKLEENVAVLSQIKKHLSADGTLVMDYMNVLHPEIVRETAQSCMVKNICFHTKKKILNGMVTKKIEVKDGDELFHYEEKVQLLDLNWFEQSLDKLNFRIVQQFGDYDLNPFDADKSKRLIMFIKHKRNDGIQSAQLN